MGHRALVGYRRPDRRYDLRYSHWGGADVSLRERISAETPLADGAVEADLLAAGVDRDRLLTGYLDPCIHEALYLVDPGADYRISAYRVCWLEWVGGRDGDRGAIVAVDGTAADRRVRTWFRATKTAVADVVEMGALSRRAARAYLEARVCEDEAGTVYTYVGAGDAETVGPGAGTCLERGADADDWTPETGTRFDADADSNGGSNDGKNGGRNDGESGNRNDGENGGRDSGENGTGTGGC